MLNPTDHSQPSSKGLLWFGISLFLAIIIIQAVLASVYFAFRGAYRRQYSGSLAELQSLRNGPPAPRLQTDPPADLRQYLDREERLLKSYGWVDEKADIARIPIERAMELLVGKSEVHRGTK